MKKMSVLGIVNLLCDADTRISMKDFRYSRIHAGGEKPADSLAFSGEDFAAISDVTFCESRANLSILVRIRGSVALPENAPAALENPFPTSVWRNYTIVRDGKLHTSSLPCRIGRGVHGVLELLGIVDSPYDAEKVYDISLEDLPIAINPSTNSERDYFRALVNLETCKAHLKAAKFFLAKLPSDEPSFIARYGEDAASYLYGLGVTENGYAPREEKKAGTTPVETTELVAKVKGLSVPSVNALLKKLDAGSRLNDGDLLLKVCYDSCAVHDGSQDAAAYYRKVIADSKRAIRSIGHDMAEIRFNWLADQSRLAPGQTLTMSGVFENDTREYSLAVRRVTEMV